MIRNEDLDPELRTLLADLGRHKLIAIGYGSKDVFVYVTNRQIKKQVESVIPEEYRSQVQVILTGRIRPAKTHEPAPKNSAKRRETRGGGSGVGGTR